MEKDKQKHPNGMEVNMEVKTFRAASMPQVLAQVKRELGPDAVIMHTRTYKQGGVLGLGQHTVVEVSARAPQAGSFGQRRRQAGVNRLKRTYSTSPVTTAAAHSSRIREQAVLTTPAARGVSVLNDDVKDEIGQIRKLVEDLVRQQRQMHSPNMAEPLFDVYLNLIQQEVADEIAREMLTEIQKELTGEQLQQGTTLNRQLLNVLEGMVSTAGPVELNLDGSARTVALIGPTGVGKTTTIAKLAAHFKLKQNKQVGLITIDTYRIGAVDQLRMYAQIIDVPLKVVLTPDQLREEIQVMSDLDIIFIDTAGRCQNDQIKIKELRSFLDAAKPHEIHLVLSTTGHHTHLVNAAERFSTLGVDRVIFTKLDEAVSFGVIFSVLKKVKASLSYITIGQDVPEDIEVGSGQRLARLLLGREPIKQSYTFDAEQISLNEVKSGRTLAVKG